MMLRNTVEDVGHWKRVFDEQSAAGQAAGLRVVDVWRSVDLET